MVKLELGELTTALEIMKRTSTDTHVTLVEDGHCARLCFSDADGQLVTIGLYHADTGEMAKITRSERMLVFANSLFKGRS